MRMATGSMRAAVARGREQVEIDAIPIPEPGPGEARVHIRACGLCGTDLHLHHAGLYPPGNTPGHEMTGVVDALGDGVEGLETGASVAVEPLHACGSCPTCRNGLDAICREGQIYGIQRPGGFAEYAVVPARRLFPVPGELVAQIAALAEPMAVVVRGLRRGAFERGQRVLVLGAGSIGLLAVAAARAFGAGEVWLTARHAHQAELGRQLGAVRVLDEGEATPLLLDGAGREAPIDLVVETVGGSADTLIQAGAAVRPGGTVSILGVFMGRTEIEPLGLFVKETTLAFSNCYTHPETGADFETAIDLVSDGRDALSALTTHAVPLDEIDRAYALAADKQSGVVKVTVLP
jgi:threonine dehydrogenase-like Zn-dependent dehydrogenase